MQPPRHVQRNRLQHACAEKHIYLRVLLIYFPLPLFQARAAAVRKGNQPSREAAAVGWCPPPQPSGPFGCLQLLDETTKLSAALQRPTSSEYSDACFGGAGAWENFRDRGNHFW